jgi:hypothetical protein
MPATPRNIWQVPAYLPFLQPPLTDEMVAEAQAKIGHPLPREYLELLAVQNGGYIGYRLPDRLNEMIAGIGPNFPSLTDVQWDQAQEVVSFPLDGLFPFDGDGHWNLCLDYRKDPANPCVSYVDVEVDSQSRVAATFADYLAKLKPHVRDDEYVVEGAGDIEAFKAMLGSTLKVKFSPADTYAHGYPIHAARFGDGWINLSPNTVRRGFVCPDDPRYEQLKDLLPGHAPRYPGAPDESIILLATGKALPKLMGAVEKSGMRVRPLRDNVKD